MSTQNKGCYAPYLNWHSFVIAGPDSKDFLHRITTANLKFLKPGSATPAFLLQNTGKVIAYFYLRCDSDGSYSAWTPMDLQNTIDAFEKLHFRENLKITAFENGLRLFTVWEKIESDWKNSILIATNSERPELEENPLYAEYLRVKMGIPAWPGEINSSLIPLEAKMNSAVHENKGCYPGQEVIERIRSIGAPPRVLCKLQLKDEDSDTSKIIPGTPIFFDSTPVGEVTSVSIYEKAWAGLGFVRRAALTGGAQKGLEHQNISALGMGLQAEEVQ